MSVPAGCEEIARRIAALESARTMTKREAFAMAAMQGLLANSTARNTDKSKPDSQAMAEASIVLADALLAALQEQK